MDIQEKILQCQKYIEEAILRDDNTEAKRLIFIKKRLEAGEDIDDILNNKPSDTPIYDTLIREAKFPVTNEKRECVESTVRQLMEEGPNANEPGLLLGKIQCGKTDTFENIIGLAFDKGIDIAVVFTKGTNTLAAQTLMRFRKDFKSFRKSNDCIRDNIVNVDDILNIYRTLSPAIVDGCKYIIICKKEASNLKHLIDMFSVGKYSEHFKKKKVLIIDDEADFASRNYKNARSVSQYDADGNLVEQPIDATMAKISQQIDDFRKLPEFCRYLQVTATPYCLYLQPQGELNLNGNKVLSFRPRFTSLVPVHSSYIGGKQYFEDSQNEESMYSHLFHPVEQKCMDVLGHEDRRYINKSSASKNISGLRYALVSYLMATSVRIIQRKRIQKPYQSSALIHVEIDKRNHDWQKRIIEKVLDDIHKYLTGGNSDLRFSSIVDDVYKDFLLANEKGRREALISTELPSKVDVISRVEKMFETQNIKVQVVNSDQMVSSLLNHETGELNLSYDANIFIGGNILDRGITISNMLCFFYGRNPKKFQQDTVLQHARMYGARDKEDMAVTRLFTTDTIYKILARMNNLDNQLRQWFIEGKDLEEPNAVFIGYDKSIKPCSPQKIKISKAVVLKGQQRFVPYGFQTGKKGEISDIVKNIDSIITGSPHYNETDQDGFFEMDEATAFNILTQIQSTYDFDGEKSHKRDVAEIMCVLKYCTSKSGDKLYALHRTNRNMMRIRENSGYVDAPDDGRTDLAPARNKAESRPVLMLIRENGDKKKNESGENIGWNGTPFYWPVLLTQNNLSPVMFAIDTKSEMNTRSYTDSDILDGINKDDVLDLTFIGDLEEAFGYPGDEYEDGDERLESRVVRENTASRYFLKTEDGAWAVDRKVVKDLHSLSHVYFYNGGKFPYVLKPYKYMLLRQGRNSKASVMLLELADSSSWDVEPRLNFDENGNLCDEFEEKRILINATDVYTDKYLNESEFMDKQICQWLIRYKIKKVLRYISGEGLVQEVDDSEGFSCVTDLNEPNAVESIHTLVQLADYYDFNKVNICSYTFKGQRHVCSKWMDMMSNVFRCLYRDYKDTIDAAAKGFHNYMSVVKIEGWSEFVDGIFVYKDKRTSNSIEILRSIFGLCNVPLTELCFEVYSKPNKSPRRSAKSAK